MSISIKYKNKLIAENIVVANDFWTRFFGYMLRKNPHVSAILFAPAGAIQTSFMKFNLDLVFLSEKNQVVKIVRNIKPWRYSGSTSKARKVLEFPIGLLPTEVKEGEFLEMS